MKTYINNSKIKVVMYLYPIIYNNSNFTQNYDDDIVASVSHDKSGYHTNVNPNRIINGPLSEPGEPLEAPINDEWEHFIEDCKFLIKELDFTIISSNRSTDSEKSEYIIVFGMKDKPCGTLVYELRLSDHPFDATFPEELKDAALQYLKINNILDGTATKAGIDFQIEKVTVGSVQNDSWERAFNRLYIRLKQIKNKIMIRLKTRGDT